MQYVILEKARQHKYIRRLGAPGSYEYVYEEPVHSEVAAKKIQKIENEIKDLKTRIKDHEEITLENRKTLSGEAEAYQKYNQASPDMKKFWARRMSQSRNKWFSKIESMRTKVERLRKQINLVRFNVSGIEKVLSEIGETKSRWLASGRVKGWGSSSTGYDIEVDEYGVSLGFTTGGSFPSEEYMKRNLDNFKARIIPKLKEKGFDTTETENGVLITGYSVREK